MFKVPRASGAVSSSCPRSLPITVEPDCRWIPTDATADALLGHVRMWHDLAADALDDADTVARSEERGAVGCDSSGFYLARAGVCAELAQAVAMAAAVLVGVER